MKSDEIYEQMKRVQKVTIYNERRNSVSNPERQKTDSHKNASLNSFRLSKMNCSTFQKQSQKGQNS